MYFRIEKDTSSSRVPPFRGSKPSEREGRHNPKFIGEIPGYPVGSRFKNRDDLSGAGVHGPLRAGIHGNKADGAYSVVLSYGYEDDEDRGEAFIYTGQGGRSTDSSKLDQMQGKESWNSHQASDQEWKLGNKALQISWLRGSPVRVIRGAPRKNSELHKYAPSEGLRYDGLYQVTDAWKDEGATGFQTCKFRFDRLPNQLPLPGRGGHASSSNVLNSSKESLKLLPVGPSPDLTKPKTTSIESVKSPRAPFVPRPPYRPSEADIAKLKLKAKSRSKSTSESHPITPEYAGATLRPWQAHSNIIETESKCPAALASTSYSASYDYYCTEDSEMYAAKDEPVSPILEPVFTRSLSSDIEDLRVRKRPRDGDGFSDEFDRDGDRWCVSSDEEDLVDGSVDGSDEENADSSEGESDSSRGDVRPWATVRGKQKLPASLSFKKRRVE